MCINQFSSKNKQKSGTHFKSTKVSSLWLWIQQPWIRHVDEKAVTLSQPDTSSLLHTVHIVVWVTPIKQASALWKQHRFEFRLGVTLMENILNQLDVAYILFLRGVIRGIPETGLGIHIIQSLFLHHKPSVVVFHLYQSTMRLVPMDSGHDIGVGCKLDKTG